ncbi:guanine permease [Companilactobacillus allii]|uniref:Guanine permease n=1 Tax=Companilactobacillus allii TaxID=1847728 RepID=A0A1P8Q5Z0_9LACO|nr:NCS2 family permease [Companilactobacillus allii]APX73245.1 guanine permease [Companilactobacillus allii]
MESLNDGKNLSFLERLFHLKEANTSVRREILAGLTTFVSMAYILFVNPQVLGDSGMDKGSLFTATALTAVVGSVLMGILANYPIAIAPGLGDNAFFSYSVVIAMGIPWQTAMAGVFIASIIFLIVSLLKLRELVINSIPQDLKLAVSAGLGLFIAFVGLQGGGLIQASKSSLVEIGSFTTPTTLLTIAGLIVTAGLMCKKVPGAIFIGMVFTTIAGLVTKLIPMPKQIVSGIPSLKPTFGVGVMHIGDIIHQPQMWAVVIIFLLVAFFDTAGTLIGLAEQASIMKDGKMPRIGRALMADSISMVSGAVFGTTPPTAYVESSAGIAVGGRTGLTSVVVGVFFAISMFFSPLLTVVTSNVTAPVLIIVGALMAQSMKGIHWEKFEIALPAFLTVLAMPLTYNITYGIAFGFLAYPLTMIAAGRRKEVNGIMYGLFFVFALLLYIINVLPHS